MNLIYNKNNKYILYKKWKSRLSLGIFLYINFKWISGGLELLFSKEKTLDVELDDGKDY